jgi:Co/Zn/Cd efflux system component
MTANMIRTHEHSFLGSSHDENARRTRSVVALTVLMMIGEIAAGYITGSMALLADGFHMATHAGALGIAALAYAFAKRNSGNRAFSFGTGRSARRRERLSSAYACAAASRPRRSARGSRRCMRSCI